MTQFDIYVAPPERIGIPNEPVRYTGTLEDAMRHANALIAPWWPASEFVRETNSFTNDLGWEPDWRGRGHWECTYWDRNERTVNGTTQKWCRAVFRIVPVA